MNKASDQACTTYYENTVKPTAHGVWSVMEKAQQKTIKAICNRSIDKMVAVANPANGIAFQEEVQIHYSILSK